MSAGTVLNKLAETAEHAREFAAQNWVDMDEDETADWRRPSRTWKPPLPLSAAP
jgi:hypothetical protein